MKRERYLWIPLLPAAWLVICTLTAGWQKVFSPNIKIGFLAHARKFADAADAGQLLAPAKSLAEMQRIIVNDRVDATLAAIFMLVVVAMIGFGIRSAVAAWRTPMPTAREVSEAVVA
jgi:carbon starvation protein